MFHLAAYSASLAGPASAFVDVTAAVDTIIGPRNNHLIFTDDFLLGLAYGLGQTLTGFRINMPTLNAWFRHQLWPLDTGAANPATVPDRPAIIDYLDYPIALPRNEEMAWEASNASAGAERNSVLVWLFTPDHSKVIPHGIQRLTVAATYAITPAAVGAWSGAGALTFQQGLRGGWYSVVGMATFDASTLAARLLFPRAKPYNGRMLRPGVINQNAVGLRPAPHFMGKLGPFGKFHAFEPVQIEIISNTAALHNGVVMLDLVYHGEGDSAMPTSY